MIQIFGTTKNFDVKSAQRYFSERSIAYSFINLKEKSLSVKEFESVVLALSKQMGSRAIALDALIDKKSKDYASIAYLDDSQIEEKLFENQEKLLKQPICRNGANLATVGIAKDVWQSWR